MWLTATSKVTCQNTKKHQIHLIQNLLLRQCLYAIYTHTSKKYFNLILTVRYNSLKGFAVHIYKHYFYHMSTDYIIHKIFQGLSCVSVILSFTKN